VFGPFEDGKKRPASYQAAKAHHTQEASATVTTDKKCAKSPLVPSAKSSSPTQ